MYYPLEANDLTDVFNQIIRFVPAATSPPLNVNGFVRSHGVLSVTWNEIPEQNRMGVIPGYNLTVKSSLHRITMEEVTLSAFTGGGQGPASSAFVVQREEEDEKQDTQFEALVNKG